jgi:hypothetical protein
MTHEHSAHVCGIKYLFQMMAPFPEGHNANSATRATMVGTVAATAALMQRVSYLLRIALLVLERRYFGEKSRYIHSVSNKSEK